MNANEFIKTISKIPYRPLTKEFKWAAQNKKILTPLLLTVLKKSISGIKKIAPLCRLWNIDENNFDGPMEFYKDSNDVLDEPNGLEKENRSW